MTKEENFPFVLFVPKKIKRGVFSVKWGKLKELQSKKREEGDT